HDESEDRAQRGDEKCGSDFNASAKISPKEADGRAGRDSCEQPDIVGQICRGNVPSRIDKGQLRGTKDFAQVKPHSPARHEDSLHWAEEGKRGAVRSLMIVFPPNYE